jgi:hypothetical protein
MTRTMMFPGLATLLGLFTGSAPAPRKPTTPAVDDDPFRTRRDFLNERLSECPEAMHSDVGMLAMMSVYPHEF